ncbi:MAG: imidazole glycerol phosphate synthase subunit HisH [Clostridiales bacterium]|nr:imidazole glycerol phosphate synthase subunit HisH [Clostridiales bacterium]MBQ5966754.1 imidazole glycerol phosphate synthase subunit HisH [Clostridiales bacterium]MBQ6270596.1 imidazole glycerol phosphate synthase subunit HisH [Clostridiales bacterium]MBR4010052.1 imidazole glycerol phosphate synthase subunit HisH [Clostridiales bacterium]MBR5418479.1 imidazole glycerol phosphate synthase subunit HisH [Clostridiales bacterium]
MIAIIDYGMGNLGSVQKALAYLGYDSEITNDPARVMDADGVVLPGVGAIGAAMESLKSKGLDKVVHEYIATGKPFLGICLGMQMLFDTSEESFGGEPVKGLSVLPGKVVKFPSDMGLKIPQIGWNELNSRCEIIPDKEYVYFVHSYYCVPDKIQDVAATVNYGIEYCCSVRRDNVFACQFHPEKSGEAGLAILNRWARQTKK